MEVLAKSYEFLIELIMSLDSGTGVRSFVQSYIKKENSSWSQLLGEVFISYQAGSLNKIYLNNVKNPFERSILHLVLKSLDGQSILKELKIIEKDYYAAHDNLLERHLVKLPYLSLLPLFLFLFPAYLLLMLGPILKNLMESFSN